MKGIILIVIILIAVGIVFDRRRRKTQLKLPAPDSLVSANELPPSETGRFRAQTALSDAKLRAGGKLEDQGKESGETASTDEKEAEEALPDPFTTTTSDKMSGPH